MPIQNQTNETVTYIIDNPGGTTGTLGPGEPALDPPIKSRSLVEFYSYSPVYKLASTRLPSFNDDPNNPEPPTADNIDVWLDDDGGGYMAGWRFNS